ncbi:prolyl aminopeptidase [Nocardia sp. CDC159]|uniref:Proline iminopeptidase n=1 Tax=Nocardia pulmonis TaxID=2951408 RepID=A0A9X2IWV3_9NOCA|nr:MULTISPECIES: prolyl aminopeptidase [Nocardia]MCM6775342.1 prolyl aminopeptidase [Nocardia pulmonis]MCM6787924.1 prolyl aminopeptidase [Nocardia sp. CDC159]
MSDTTSSAPQMFPEVEPDSSGLLDVGDGQRIYWEAAGDPAGKPVLVVHGGPGGGGRRGLRRSFDPARYRVVMFDQRGCGASLPHPSVSLEHNTTGHLIADMERLREHLGFERWSLLGGSWGSTLILVYAQAYPQRVGEIVLIGVTTTTPAEIDWLYRGVGLLLPDAWERFRAGVPEAERDGDLVAAYARLVNDPDPAVRERAARMWCEWEDAVIAHESAGTPGQYSAKLDADLMAFVRICTHYFAHRAWLSDGQLLAGAHRLDGIPATLIHGRLDLSAPLRTAWELAKAWPSARLRIIEDSGHTGSPAMRDAVLAAVAEYGRG